MKVVLALDTSSASAAVLETAVSRPWPPRSFFEVVSVAEPSLAWTTAKALLEAESRAQHVVADAIARFKRDGLHLTGAVFSGNPRRILLQRARALSADLVMTGSGADPGQFFGGTRMGLLRYAPCSVEFVRLKKGHNPGGLKIVLATDGSCCAERAAQSIAARPWPPGTSVRILNVPELMLPSAPRLGAELADSGWIESVHTEAILQAHRAVARAREILESSGLSISESISSRVASPKLVISEEAAKWHADLIVLGARGQGGDHLLTGSVAEAVAMRAECSVAVIR